LKKNKALRKQDDDGFSSSEFDDGDTIDIHKKDDSFNDNDFFQENLGNGMDNFADHGIMPIEKHSDLLKSLTDFNPFLKTMVAEWLGMVWNQEKEKYIHDPDVMPIMNVKGARWSVNFLRVYTRDNNIITNIDKDTYRNMMYDVIDTALLNIGTRAEEFAINNDGDVILVSNQLIHSTSLVLIGASGNKVYNDLLGSTVSVNRSENFTQQQPNNSTMGGMSKKSGFLDGVKGMFKGG